MLRGKATHALHCHVERLQPGNEVGCAAETSIELVRPICAVTVNRRPDATPDLPEYRYPFNKVENQ